jgi:choline kinase
MRLIILAAGTGSRLAPLTNDRPKCLVELAGRPLLEWTLAATERSGIDEVVVIGGYRAEQLRKYDVTLLVNENFATTNMVHTLFRARAYFGDGFIMSYGDIAYAPDVLERLMDAPPGVSVVVDADWRSYWERRFDDPLKDAETLKLADDGRIVEIGNRPRSFAEIDAQYIGLVAFKGGGVSALERAIEAAGADQARGRNPFGCPRPLDALYMTDLLQGMIALGERVMPLAISGQWIEVDSCSDLALAEGLVKQGRLAGAGRGANS